LIQERERNAEIKGRQESIKVFLEQLIFYTALGIVKKK